MNMPKRLNYYRLSASEVLEQLDSRASGLTPVEANKRLNSLGPNLLMRTKHESALTTFVRQFKNLLVIMLLVSAGLSVYLHDTKTATILVLIAVMNAVVGFIQEHKAETLMKSLERLLVPQAKVIRDGQMSEINSTELVLGDVVYLAEGDSAPADLRVLDEQELSSNDFALTGESNPSRKFVHAIGADVVLGNRHNLVFMGTTVATGSAHGVVVATGMQTELGRIASLSQATRSELSPLQLEMDHLAQRLLQATLVLAGLLVIIAVRADLGLQAAILFGVGISAAMIPTALVAEVNITLALTAGRLSRRRALVKKLSAVETLGATNIILTDKTGTLTKNEMTVQQLLIGRSHYNVTGTGYQPSGDITSENGKPLTSSKLRELDLFFACAALASNAHVNPADTEHSDWYVVGDPTEGALITLANKAGLDIASWESDQPELREFQFDSARKLLSSVRRRGDETVVYVKGAPESLLAASTDIWDHGHVRKLTAADRKYYDAYNQQQAGAAKRNLAFGYRVLPSSMKPPFKMENVEQKFVFLGMASMVDPLRSAVPAAMRAANRAHISVSIITGDFPITAAAIAEQAQLSK
ncbi:MAG: HAD-IC family P-type ATPase, partial [Candidatus Saccharimonadales bacterium]